MKKIVKYSSLLILIIFSCSKTTQPPLPTELYLSGLVVDRQTSMPIDSVEITLTRSSNEIFSSSTSYLTTFYTGTDGKFNFHFVPKDSFNYDYAFLFRKNIYRQLDKSIDRKVKYQEFNVSLEK